MHSTFRCKCVLVGKQYTKHIQCKINANTHCKRYYLTMKDAGNEVVMARGKPKPTKYGQLHSMYDSRLCTSQPSHKHTTVVHS